MSQYLFFLLILACPLMMIFMMRGHGHAGHGNAHGANGSAEPSTLAELHRRRDQLDREIAACEGAKEVDHDRSPERV